MNDKHILTLIDMDMDNVMTNMDDDYMDEFTETLDRYDNDYSDVWISGIN
jgi:hypothetical protein